MNLEVLKNYFAHLAQAEIQLENSRKGLDLHRINSYHYYALIATKSQSQIDHQLIVNFIKSFTYNFQVKQPHQLIKDTSYEIVPPENNASQDQLISKGVNLFLNKWGNQGKINFYQFSNFLKGEEDNPEPMKQIDYSLKKKFYQMIQDEIQNLLDSQTFRKLVAAQYKNFVDLFELISKDNLFGLDQLKNLFLMFGSRRNEEFFQLIARRFQFPCNFDNFKDWFKVITTYNKYRQQTKIFYSSIKKKKYNTFDDNEQEDRFSTPNGKKTTLAQVSSTKMTKGQRLNSIKRSKVEVSRFRQENVSDTSSKKGAANILGEILQQQQKLNELKRQLVYRQDYDLQLIYQRKGKQFQQLLNYRYGTCNFTSFVRYIVPQNFQHRYYAFIKYEKTNNISNQTLDLINRIIDDEYTKQQLIKGWWNNLDRQLIFRGYCNPGSQGIKNQYINKYFTERQCKILLDRMDPYKTGQITYQNFY